MKKCKKCGFEFDPIRPNRTLCDNCSRSVKRSKSDTVFISVDGEGVTNPETGEHNYVLLSVGNKSIRGTRITMLDAFPFLWQEFRMNPDAAFVGFYLSYDFAQWFRVLPEERARMLFTPQGRAMRQPNSPNNPVPYPVRWAGWEFDMLGLRRLKLRPDNNSEAPWLYVCDAGPFWQTSFLNAVNPDSWDDPICSPEEYALIREGKEHRADAELDAAMTKYNVTENATLSRAMHKLAIGFHEQGWNLRKSQWFGPGQAADAWLHTTEAPLGNDVQTVTPEPVLQAARASYYGGWFEIPRHGHVPGTSYEYDINSAYPAVIAKLPCLMHGTWTQSANLHDTSLVNVTTYGSNPYLGGLPHRNEHGIISRPHSTTGWYWFHELSAAMDAGLIDRYDLHDKWTYVPCDCLPPMRDIANLYQQRLAIGKNTAHGKALKLVYNSAYGKFCQSVGSPKFANPIYASLITAGCRTAILGAIASHPNGARDVLMVATDGIYFRTRHSSLDLSSVQLGAWDEGTKENLTLFMPGVYWDDKGRSALAGNVQLKSRGINGKELAKHIDKIDAQFYAMQHSDWGFEQWPHAEIPVQFSVIGPQLAIARNNWKDCGRTLTYEFDDTTKDLSSNPSNKRNTSRTHIADGLITTVPYESFGPSVPYDKTFGMDLATMAENDLITGDVGLSRELAEGLGIVE